MLTDTSPEVREFVAAAQENRDLAKQRSAPSGYRIVVVVRRKYLAVDEIPTFEGRDCSGQSGRFLVDRETAEVFTIRGYGQRGWRVGTLETLTEKFRAGSATFDPAAGCHWETSRGHVATWPTPRPKKVGPCPFGETDCTDEAHHELARRDEADPMRTTTTAPHLTLLKGGLT